MKKGWLLACIAAFLLLPAIPCRAEEETIGVYARYEGTEEEPFVWISAPVSEGKAQAVMDERVTIRITNAPPGAESVSFRVFPETGQEIRDWIRSLLGDGMEIKVICEVRFADAGGNRIAAGDAKVTLVDTGTGEEETMTRIAAEETDYYVQTKKEVLTDPDETETGDVQTGDAAAAWLWMILLCTAAGIVVFAQKKQ